MAASSSKSEKTDYLEYRPSKWLREVTNLEICETKPSDKNVKWETDNSQKRFLVAAKNFSPGSIVIHELPLVVGPCGYSIQCLGCYKVLTEPEKCGSCGWPICRTDCVGLGYRFGHSNKECEVLSIMDSKDYLNYNDLQELLLLYHVVMPLRCLFLKDTEPQSFEYLLNLESNFSKRREDPRLWEREEYRVVNKIRTDLGLSWYTADEIHTVCGIIQTNSLVIGDENRKILAIYPRASLMKHNCFPNTYHTDYMAKHYALVVRAIKSIQIGCPITATKSSALIGTIRRKDFLRKHKFINCFCERCLDPKELGSYMSAFLCPKCRAGWVLPMNVALREADWICFNDSQKCPGFQVPVERIDRILDDLIEHLNEIPWGHIDLLENFLRTQRTVLHPWHYINVKVKLILSRTYANPGDLNKHEEGYVDLERKVAICCDIMRLLDIVEPSFSTTRAVTLYELYDAKRIILAKRLIESKLTKTEFYEKHSEIDEYILESFFILDFEPFNTVERLLKN